MRVLDHLRFRPTLWPTVFTIPALILLLGLGTWQVQRLHWKENLIATRHDRSTGPAIPLPADNADPATYEFSKTRATGHFLNDKEMYLAARSLHGNIGFHVVTPLVLADGSAVLVDRGWVPTERRDPASRKAGELDGTVTIEGLLRGSQKQSWLVPDNEPKNNTWFYVDVPAMAKWAGLARAHPYFVEAGPAPNPGGYPIGGQSHLELPNNHLQYAFIWYSFAVSLSVIYVLYHRKRDKELAEQAAKQAAESRNA
jgi:surfeit locus 1 family protein